MAQYRYLHGSRDSREAVEFDITRRGQYVTTCVVDVDLLLCGFKAFPCGNGDDLKPTPEQRLEILEFVQDERKKITDGFPVKTYAGWQASGFHAFSDYCFPGDKVDEEMVEYFVNSAPPVLTLSFCTQSGEAWDYKPDGKNGNRPTYVTFHDLGGGYWQFDGYCFYKENTNRENGPSRLVRCIAEALAELYTLAARDGGEDEE